MATIATHEIHDFNFQKRHHHVALVDKAANKTEVMIMKSDHEITISTSMKNFLEKFYGMWSEDAAALAATLGFSDGKVVLDTNLGPGGLAHDYGGVYDNFPKYVNPDGSNPMMYKSANEFLAGEFSSLELLKGENLPDTLPYSVTEKIKAVESAYLLLKTSEESSDEDNINIDNGDSMKELTKEEILKQAEANAAMLKEIETLKAQSADMEVMKTLVNEMKAEKELKARADMVELVKGYAFVNDEAQEALVTSLLAVTDNAEILKALEAGREAVAASVNLEEETGTSGAEGEVSKSDVEKGHDITSNILKSRNKGTA